MDKQILAVVFAVFSFLFGNSTWAGEQTGAKTTLSISGKINYKLFSLDDKSKPMLVWNGPAKSIDGKDATFLLNSSTSKTNDKPNTSTQEIIGSDKPSKGEVTRASSGKGNGAQAFLTPDLETEYGGYVGLKVQSDSNLEAGESANTSSVSNSQWRQSFVMSAHTRALFDVDARAAVFLKNFGSKDGLRQSGRATLEFYVSQGKNPYDRNILLPKEGEKNVYEVTDRDLGNENVASKIGTIILSGTLVNESDEEIHGSVFMWIKGETAVAFSKDAKTIATFPMPVK